MIEVILEIWYVDNETSETVKLRKNASLAAVPHAGDELRDSGLHFCGRVEYVVWDIGNPPVVTFETDTGWTPIDDAAMSWIDRGWRFHEDVEYGHTTREAAEEEVSSRSLAVEIVQYADFFLLLSPAELRAYRYWCAMCDANRPGLSLPAEQPSSASATP